MSDTDKRQDETPDEQESSPADPARDENTPVDEAAAGNDLADEPTSVEQAPDEREAADDSTTAADVPPPKKTQGKRGNGVAWLALLLSASALGAVGYTIFQDWRHASANPVEDAVAGVESQLSATRRSLSELESRVRNIDAGTEDSAAAIEALRSEMDERLRLLSSLPGRMTTLEGSMAALAGVSASARNTWLLAEAEYYLQIANAQLQLANNPRLASMALTMADERVVQIADPALTDVRRAIADELAALDVMEKPDIAGVTLTLASLARVVESLPLARTSVAPTPATEDFDAEQGRAQRAWAAVKSAFSGLIRVTPPEQEKLALLTPDAESFLRNNIALQLQSARLALLRGEQAIFEQTLDDAAALLDDYFDTDSAQVASARETLSEIRGNVLSTSVPDISASLRLLRQYRALAENSQ